MSSGRKGKTLNSKTRSQKAEAQKAYSEAHREVKASVRKDRTQKIFATQAEKAAQYEKAL